MPGSHGYPEAQAIPCSSGLCQMEYQPLLSPGLHELDESELDNHFASSFPNSTTRLQLIAGLRAFVSALKQMELTFEIWIDGSFTTSKPDPNDIDLVIFADDAAVDELTMDKKLTLASLINREETRRSFGLDVLFCPASNIELRSYWRGWYGYDRAENPKGIAKIVVSP